MQWSCTRSTTLSTSQNQIVMLGPRLAAGQASRSSETRVTFGVVPLPLRVDPFGDLHAVKDRGTAFGNRGILHDDQRQIVRPWAHQNWICCALEFRGLRHDVLAVPPNTYTGLFFRDEATALATGARPCFFCRRADAVAYIAALEAATGERLNAPSVDRRLHSERIDRESSKRGGNLASRRRLWPVDEELPVGAMVVDENDRVLVVTPRGLRGWAFGELGESQSLSGLRLLTPPTNVAALRAGYLPTTLPLIAG